MSATGDGAADFLATAATITAPTSAYSYTFWYLPTHVPAVGATISNPFALTAGGGATCDIGFTWDHTGGTFYRAAAHLNSDLVTATRAQFPTAPASGVWIHIGVTWDGTNIRLYYNGLLVATSAAGSNPASTNPTVTVLAYAGGASGFMDGSIGEVCVWGVTLTAAEIFAIGTGTLATTIQNGSIRFYSTCNTGDPGAIGPALTNTGCTINSSYFGPQDGGMKFGGDGTASVTAYNWTTNIVGAAFGGGDTIIATDYGWVTSVGFALGGDQPVATAYGWITSVGMALGGSMPAATTYAVACSGGMALGGDQFRTIHATANGAVALASQRVPAFTTK